MLRIVTVVVVVVVAAAAAAADDDDNDDDDDVLEASFPLQRLYRPISYPMYTYTCYGKLRSSYGFVVDTAQHPGCKRDDGSLRLVPNRVKGQSPLG